MHYAVKWSASIKSYDLKKKLPHADGSIDYVYTSHFLEHLSRDDAGKLIREAFRVLKPGGLVRVVVPDLAIGASHYVATVQSNPNDAKAAPEFLDWLQLSRPGARDPHLWMYDAPSLTAVLSECGFINAVVCEHKQGRVPDCDILDNRSEDSLHLEAAKPSVQ
jgi:SAM-dependent methyltransferase